MELYRYLFPMWIIWDTRSALGVEMAGGTAVEGREMSGDQGLQRKPLRLQVHVKIRQGDQEGEEGIGISGFVG